MGRCTLFLPCILALLLLIAIHSSAAVNSLSTVDSMYAAKKSSSGKEVVLPHVHYDITSAELWRCSTVNIDDKEMKVLTSRSQQHQLEVLKHGDGWIDLLTPKNPTDILHSFGLAECSSLTSLRELLTTELVQNWGTLQHHSLHPLWQNSQNDTSHSAQQTHVSESSEHQKQIHVDKYDILKRDVGSNRQNPKENAEKCTGPVKCDKKRSEDSTGSGSERTDSGWFTRYHNISEIYDWFNQLAEDHPNIVSLNESIGKTYYGRDILAVHFTNRQGVGQATLRRPKIYLQCLLHPREWISGSVCMYLAETLASPDSQPKLVELLSKVEFVMVPVANPDGYFLTWLQYPKYRLWRKNMQSFEGSSCAGVDLNRNFNVSNWNQEAQSFSSDHCSELYGGPQAGSEMEVRAITAYFESLNPVIGAIDFHSYHQEVLYPPASSYEVPDQVLETIDRVAQSVAARASEAGVNYSSKKMIDIYSATGTFADWMLMKRLSADHDNGCLVPLTIELRPTFDDSRDVYSGFLLPATQIHPTCQEMLPAVIVFAELIQENSTSCLTRP